MLPSTHQKTEARVLSDNDSMKKFTTYNSRNESNLTKMSDNGGYFDAADRVSDERLGFWDLWRSLPKPCKLFLALCFVQAFVIGSFASTELAKEGMRNLQDLVLLLVSSVVFLCIVADAFWHENAYQLLVSMASGALNLAQLIIYSVC